ncbi:MAG: hypothetical protein HXL09_01250 [Candidatus Nanosynbacter sp.]|nr:hypothetical protein [Candidatus Nanosynbacter sp.]
MKILIKDTLRNKETLYLQKCDVRYLLEHPDIIRSPKIKPGSPKAIELDEIEAHGYEGFLRETLNDEANRLVFESDLCSDYDFRITYRDPASIGWINSHKWIYDYEEYIVESIDRLTRDLKKINKSIEVKLAELDDAEYEYQTQAERANRSHNPSVSHPTTTNTEAAISYEDILHMEHRQYDLAEIEVLKRKKDALRSMIQYHESDIEFTFPTEFRGLVRNTSLSQRMKDALSNPTRKMKN